jgi:hypothetical protein
MADENTPKLKENNSKNYGEYTLAEASLIGLPQFTAKRVNSLAVPARPPGAPRLRNGAIRTRRILSARYHPYGRPMAVARPPPLPPPPPPVSAVGVMDIGAGNCNLLFAQNMQPITYYDVGYPLWFYFSSAPDNLRLGPNWLGPILQNATLNLNIVLSHWDRDHWRLGRLANLQNLAWLYPGQPVVQSIQFEFQILSPFTPQVNFAASLAATMQIPGLSPFEVGGRFPDQSVFVQLTPGQTLSVNNVFDFFSLPLPQGFPAVDITTLSFNFYVPQKRFTFELLIDNPIPIYGSISLDLFTSASMPRSIPPPERTAPPACSPRTSPLEARCSPSLVHTSRIPASFCPARRYTLQPVTGSSGPLKPGQSLVVQIYSFQTIVASATAKIIIKENISGNASTGRLRCHHISLRLLFQGPDRNRRERRQLRSRRAGRECFAGHSGMELLGGG